MGTITINGKKVEFTDEKNVLTIIRKAGFEVPTLCYQPELSIFGACRLCMVEDDRGRFFASCSEEPRDGMVIYTHTERLRKNRKLIVELLLAAHCRDCTTCDKHGKCKLQKLAYQLGIAPQILVLPAIMAGNTVFVVLLRLIAGTDSRKVGQQIAAWLIAALGKFAVLYLIVVKVVCGVMAPSLLAAGTLKEPMLKALPATFSWPQLITALIGGGIALLIVPVIRKALHR